MATVSKYRKSRRTRLVQRMDEASDPREAARLAAVIYKTCFDRKRRADGGPGSGNWGHESVPGYQGGSAPGGGVQNRQTTESGGYTSFSKMKAAAAKLHVPSIDELSNLPEGSVIHVSSKWSGADDFSYTVSANPHTGKLCFNAEGGFNLGSQDDFMTSVAIAEEMEAEGGCKISIPDEANPNYLVDHTTSASEYSKMADNSFAAHTAREYDNEYRKQAGEIYSNLDYDTKEALDSYTGNGYSAINGTLRDGNTWNGTMNEEIDRITDAINQSTLQEDTTLYRGVGTEGFELLMGKEPGSLTPQTVSEFIGESGTEDGFMSTGSAEGKGFVYEGVQLKILAPAGTKALYAEPFSALGKGAGINWDDKNEGRGRMIHRRNKDGVSSQKYFSNEDETIVQRGSTLNIISGQYNNSSGQYEFTAVITDQDYENTVYSQQRI